jgi:hypothetical protein
MYLPIDTSVPVTGAVTVEPRNEASHNIVFTFNNPITSTGTLSITDVNGTPVGSGSLSSANGDIVVTLTGVEGRKVRVSLAGVNSALTVSASMAFLPGAELGGSAVTSKDILKEKGQQGQFSNTGNFRYDVDLGGSVVQADLDFVKSRAGRVLQ